MNKFVFRSVAAAAIFVASSAAHALPSVSTVLPSGPVLMSDDSAEYLIKGPGNSGTVLQSGDRLRGIFEINKTQATTGGAPQQSVGGLDTNELTGIFDITVTGTWALGETIRPGVTCTSAACFQFGPTASFAAEMAGKGFSTTAGAMVAFFEDINGNDFNRGLNSIATMEANATDGNAFWLAGFGQEFDFWTARADSNDISIASILPFNTPFGQFALGLSLLDNPTGPDLGLVDCANTQRNLFTDPLALGQTNFCGNGGLLAKGNPANSGSFQTAYDSLDDVNFNVNIIPEPSSIALAGLALLGMGALARRRKA